MRTLIVFVLLVLLGLMAMTSVYAISLEDKEKQRDLPASSLELVVVDPANGMPIELPGSQGKPVMASPKNTPLGAVVLVNPVVDLGERRLDRVEVRLDMEVTAVIKKPPFAYEIETQGLRPGINHTVQVLVVRTDGRYTSAVGTFWLSPVALEAYKPKRIDTVIKPIGLDLPMPSHEQTVYCPYVGLSRVALGDRLEARKDNRLVGFLEVSKLGSKGFWTRVIRGESPQGAELYPHQEVN